MTFGEPQYRLFVTLPEKLSMNQYRNYHYHKLNSKKRLFHEAIIYSKRGGFMPKPPFDTEYHFILHGATLDASNTSAMVKMLEDGMVHDGLFKDDTLDIVKKVTITEQRVPEEYKKKKVNYCLITIRPHNKAMYPSVDNLHEFF